MHLYSVEARAWGGDDVAVGRGLWKLHCLLLLQDQETVELGGGLFLIIVPAQIQQTDGLGTGLGHNSLQKKEKKKRENNWTVNMCHVFMCF